MNHIPLIGAVGATGAAVPSCSHSSRRFPCYIAYRQGENGSSIRCIVEWCLDCGAFRDSQDHDPTGYDGWRSPRNDPRKGVRR